MQKRKNSPTKQNPRTHSPMTNKTTHSKSKTFLSRHSDILVCLLLIILTLSVYLQVKDHEFINFDDDQYVTDNRHVKAGFSFKNITWAFTTTHMGNWHPLTWLSHMLDCQLFGMNPGWHHLTNLFLHIINILLLFIVLKKMTGNLWQSGLVASLFALHPLHVESVAWISERKDVLSTFFWMLTMWSYIYYVNSPCAKRYLLVLLFLTLGLMSKPMLVTIPFVLILLDYWPLNRIQIKQTHNDRSAIN
ncbi:MAG TPA: glycosyltransferase family 39 protein, partial [Desulfatiglandales bacterium]|nr:glycosyltransferase family 39 protein [Desulfatiglandales bacterium]